MIICFTQNINIISQPFDEKKVLEESLETLSRQRSNEDGDK